MARRRGAGVPRPALAALAACWLLTGTAWAQEMRFESWTTENGLPQNSVTDIAQTPDGYLWLATFGGLVRFDGSRFTVFDSSTEGVGSVRTRALHVDRAGTLWAGTDDGAVLRYREGRFTTFTNEDGLEGEVAVRIDQAGNGDIWITWVDTVTRFDGERFENYRPDELPFGVRPRATSHHPYWPRALWWSADAAGVHCLLDGRVQLCLAAHRLPSAAITSVSADTKGNIWFHTARNGLIRKANERLDDLSPQEALAGAAVRVVLLEDRSSALWVLERGGQLERIREGRRAVAPLNNVLCVFEDREGSLWIGSASGLHRLREPVISMISRENGLSWNNVYSLLRDRRGQVWVGTWGGGLIRLTNGEAFTFGVDHGLPATEVTAVFEDASGRLLVGTARGLVYLSGSRLLPYEDPRGWLGGNIWAIQEDDEGFWFGTDEGLVRQVGSRFERFTAADGLAHSRVTALLPDRSGTLWIGTLRGLTALRNGVFTTLDDRAGFVGNQVRAFLEDARGVLWVGTYDGGLYRLEDGRLTRYTTRNGLFDNGVFQILDDGQGHFWIGSNRGIYRVSQAELDDVARGRSPSIRSVAFGTRDGMATAECNGGRQPAGMRMPDGTLWFPTQGGIAIVDPAGVRRNPHAPPVLIEDVRLAGEPTSFGAGIEVPPDRNSLEVRYTAMTFLRPEQTRFRYRLVGLDEAWIEAGNRREAMYYRIPPGRYRFEVTAANSDGVWNPSGASIAVVVHAPVWRRGWFLTLAALAVVGGTVLSVRHRFDRLRRERDQQQAFGRQLLDTQEQERRRISNELHDSLGQDLFMIKTRARAYGQDTADASVREVLESIEALASDSYGDMKRIAHHLRPYQLDKIGLSRTIEGMLRRVGESCEITIDLGIEDVDRCFSPSEAINVFRIVQEAINNVLRHAGAANAMVSVGRSGSTVAIVVADDGKGFDAASAGSGMGFGLMGIRERALALGGEVTIRSRPGGGTRVEVTMPVGEAADG